jgi:hypothetical protein
VNFIGSYWEQIFEEFNKNLRSWGSVFVVQRANQESRVNIISPPRKVCNKLKTAAPMTMAKKNNFLSAPMIVRGTLRERNTGLTLRCIMVHSYAKRAAEFRERAKT